MKVRKVCRRCQSEMVSRDAIVMWNKDRQDWEIVNILDDSDCAECGESGNNILKDAEL
jgi:hypothetical protein